MVRQERTRCVLEALEPWLRMKIHLISRKTKLAEAIRCALSRWQGLCCSSRTVASRSTAKLSSAPSVRLL